MAIIMTIMARRRPYTLIYPPAVNEHLGTIDAKYHRLIREKIEEQLLFEPTVETEKPETAPPTGGIFGSMGDPLWAGQPLSSLV